MRIKPLFRVVVALVAVAFVASCAQLKRVGFRSYQNSFTRSLKAHTRSKTLYRDFTTIAIAKATHFDKRLMRSYIEYTQGIDVSKTTDKRYIDTLKQCDRYEVFWLAFYTDDDDINNLASKDSFWNVYLESDGRVIEPASIREVGINDFRKQWLYLIKFNRWAREYVILFKKDSALRTPLRLVITSYLGEIDMQFRK